MANWAFGRFLCKSDARECGAAEQRPYTQWHLYHEEGEIACVRLHGDRAATRKGWFLAALYYGGGRLVSEPFRLLLSDTTIPAEKRDSGKETEASLHNYQSAWLERHERDDASIATDQPYYQ
jgi:hypothetical protein